MTTVNFKDANYFKVKLKVTGELTDVVLIPVAKEGAQNLRVFLNRLMEENKIKQHSDGYKILEELEFRLGNVLGLMSLTSTVINVSVDDKGLI